MAAVYYSVVATSSCDCYNLLKGMFYMRRRQWHPTPALLPGKSPWMEEPGRLQSMGSLRVRHAWVTSLTFHFHALGKEMATHSSVLAWRIPGAGEPGGLPSMGSHRVRHDWSDLAAAAFCSVCVAPPPPSALELCLPTGNFCGQKRFAGLLQLGRKF